MSKAILVDSVTAVTANTDLTLAGNGTGVPDLEAAFKVGGVAPTAGQVVTDAGWADAAGGAWAVKSSGTFSAVSSLEFTGISKTTRFVMSSIEYSVDNGSSQLTVSADGGTTYASANYYLALLGHTSANVTNNQTTTNGPQFFVDSGNVGNAAGENQIKDWTVYDPQDAGVFTVFEFNDRYMNTAGEHWMRQGSGHHAVAQAINALKWTVVSGTFSGSYTVLELN